MKTVNMIKRAIVAGMVLLSLGFALAPRANASVAPVQHEVVQPVCGDGNESHGKG